MVARPGQRKPLVFMDSSFDLDAYTVYWPAYFYFQPGDLADTLCTGIFFMVSAMAKNGKYSFYGYHAGTVRGRVAWLFCYDANEFNRSGRGVYAEFSAIFGTNIAILGTILGVEFGSAASFSP